MEIRKVLYEYVFRQSVVEFPKEKKTTNYYLIKYNTKRLKSNRYVRKTINFTSIKVKNV